MDNFFSQLLTVLLCIFGAGLFIGVALGYLVRGWCRNRPEPPVNEPPSTAWIDELEQEVNTR